MIGFTTCERWAALWRSNTRLEGDRSHIMFHAGMPMLFHTRKEAAAWIKESHGYIARRLDLRRAPFYWRMPIPVRVKVSLRPTSTNVSTKEKR